MQNRAEYFFNDGVAYAQLGQHEEAIASYDKAIAINPDYTEVRESREVALKNKGG